MPPLKIRSLKAIEQLHGALQDEARKHGTRVLICMTGFRVLGLAVAIRITRLVTLQSRMRP